MRSVGPVATTFHVYRPAAEKRETHTVMLVSEPSYDEIKAVVGPYLEDGRMEHVSILFNGVRSDMFVDEDFNEKGLELNEEATKIYHASSLQREPEADTSDWPKIRGVAVVFDRRIWF